MPVQKKLPKKEQRKTALFFDSKRLADAIINKRSTEGITTRVAAEQTGLRISSIFKLEAQQGNPQIHTLLKAVNWLGQDITNFVYLK